MDRHAQVSAREARRSVEGGGFGLSGCRAVGRGWWVGLSGCRAIGRGWWVGLSGCRAIALSGCCQSITATRLAASTSTSSGCCEWMTGYGIGVGVRVEAKGRITRGGNDGSHRDHRGHRRGHRRGMDESCMAELHWAYALACGQAFGTADRVAWALLTATRGVFFLFV